MKAVTINELRGLCMEQAKKGNGEKKILISADDEGNGYHELFYGFLESFEYIKDYQLPYGVNSENINDYIILG